MWVILAFWSASFAGLTSILAKCGMKDVDSNLATALRTIIVLGFSWLMVFVAGAQDGLSHIGTKIMAFLLLSGLSTGASWLCYFHALQIGDVNKVTPVDKSSTVMTMALSALFLGEPMGGQQMISMAFIGGGTYLMIQKQKVEGQTQTKGSWWLLYAFGSALFASLTAILGKIGMTGIDSNVGTAIRTTVVLVMAWGIVVVTGKQKGISKLKKKSWMFLILSGLATGGSWLCFYRALQTGPASVVVPIDKLSILVTIAFSCVVFREKLSKRAAAGLILVVCGTLFLLVGTV